MTYKHHKRLALYWRLPKSARTGMTVLPVVLVLAGAYALSLLYAPQLAFIPGPVLAEPIHAPTDTNDQPAPTGDYLSIAKLNLQVPFFTGTAATLEKGAWHRFPERGNPETGGNFILSAHRFNLGLTPQRTKVKSPFYNLHKLAVGDSIRAWFQGKAYVYEVTRLYEVGPHDTHIEDSSDTAKMTLYSCLIAGAEAGRLVVEAEPVL